jgi:hypothetical protein
MDTVEVRCPYCYEALELWVDPDTRGSFVQDCDVCCRPWQVYVERDPETGELYASVQRAS